MFIIHSNIILLCDNALLGILGKYSETGGKDMAL